MTGSHGAENVKIQTLFNLCLDWAGAQIFKISSLREGRPRHRIHTDINTAGREKQSNAHTKASTIRSTLQQRLYVLSNRQHLAVGAKPLQIVTPQRLASSFNVRSCSIKGEAGFSSKGTLSCVKSPIVDAHRIFYTHKCTRE